MILKKLKSHFLFFILRRPCSKKTKPKPDKMPNPTWAHIVKQFTPAVSTVDPDSGSRAIANAISQRNAAHHAVVAAKVKRQRQQKKAWSQMERNSAALEHYADRDMSQAFKARIEMAADAGAISKDLAGDLGECADAMQKPKKT